MTDPISEAESKRAPLAEGALSVSPLSAPPSSATVGPFRVLIANDTTEIPPEHQLPLAEE